MSDEIEAQDVIVKARRDAVIVHAQQVHFDAFASAVHRARASDPKDPVTADQAKAVQDAETGSRAVLSRLARMNGLTPAKALAEASDEYEKNLKRNLDQWEQELVIVLDMIDHPDEYAFKLLDGRPMDVEALKSVGVPSLQAVIAHAKAALGIEDPAPKKPKRASSV